MKPSERIEYKDSDGLSVPLYRLVTLEPSWATSRINYSVDRIATLETERDRLRESLKNIEATAAGIPELTETSSTEMVNMDEALSEICGVARDALEESR